jgi:transcriptional regulator with XRE-family HTH domain
MNIGKAIRELRKQRGWSQGELGNKAGITQAALSAIESKGVRPNPDTLKNLCLTLQVPESLLYVMGMERTDVPQQKQMLYDELFPVIQDLVKKVALV